MSLLHAAVPLFFTLIALEWMIGRWRGRRVYDLHDSVTDLGCGMLSQIVGVFLAVISLGAYRYVGEHAALRHYLEVPPWPAGSALASWRSGACWLAVFVLVDFGQYWVHRASHRVSLLWACHLVHHSSEELNYAVALRNSSLHGMFLWIVPLPLAVVGVPWNVFAACYGMNVAYQFFLHTRIIGSLGPMETVFNTPSHHRVHHGRDAEYLDRNFAGVLIVWDRLFGTFTREGREPEYGVYPQPPGSNPVWTNLWGFDAIRLEMGRSPDLRGKLRALLGPPAWKPAAAPVSTPSPGADSGRLLVSYALAQFLVLLIATVDSLGELGRAPLWDVAAFGVLAGLVLTGVGGALDAKPWVPRFEVVRLASVGAACLLPGIGESVFLPPRAVLIYVALSLAGLLVVVAGQRHPSRPGWPSGALENSKSIG